MAISKFPDTDILAHNLWEYENGVISLCMHRTKLMKTVSKHISIDKIEEECKKNNAKSFMKYYILNEFLQFENRQRKDRSFIYYKNDEVLLINGKKTAYTFDIFIDEI